MKKAALFAFCMFLLQITIKPTFATESNVVLNEICPQPTDGSADWIELYNTSSDKFTLSEWKLSTSTIANVSMQLIQNNNDEFIVIGVGDHLKNGGDKLVLEKVDGSFPLQSFNYTSSEPGKSFARIPDGTGTWSPGRDSTKGESNGTDHPTPTPLPQTGNIILSEFMPNPSSGDEWTEVYNPNNSDIDIGGWKIDDGEGGSSPYSIPAGTKIGAKAYAVFSFSAKLNNSGDTIRLLGPSGTVVESYSFGETTKGVAFAKDSAGHWQQTSTPTPGAANKITAASNSTKPQATKATSDSKASSQTNSTTLSTGGVEADSLNAATASGSSGKVAGISEKSSDNKKLSILLIAAGLSCLITAFAWPFLEKGIWKS